MSYVDKNMEDEMALKVISAVLLCISFLLLSACGKADKDIENFSSTDELNVSENFNFEMKKTITISKIEIPETSVPEGIKASIWTDIPENNGKMLGSALTGKSGEISLSLSVPAHLDKVFMSFGYVGILNGVWINTETGKIILKDDEFEGIELEDTEQTVALRNTPIAFKYLGTFNSDGVPDYLEAERDKISRDFLDDVNASLPERVPLTESHPGYLTSEESINIEITEEADVWVTFVHEGAGYKNALGFYTYKKGNPPQQVSDISEHTVIFPNVSYWHSGGGLYSGDKVFIGRFQADTIIGFFLVANGFRENTVTSVGRNVYYSNVNLNPEPDKSLRQHNVMIWDEERELVLMGFEDLRRDSSGCDNDFNDAVFYITSNPVEAIDVSMFKPIDKPIDTDGDGISDVFDEYPEDPKRAFNNYFPSKEQWGTLAFEDSWPKKGDYDFNDAFFHFNFKYVTNSRGEVVDIIAIFKVVAIGAAYYNGPALLFDFDPEKIKSITGQKLFDSVFPVNENGTEKGVLKTVVPVTDNLHKLMGNNQGTFINTDPALPFVEPVEIEIVIELDSPMKISEIGLPPYNPFLVINKDRSKEIHLPGKKPSSKADSSLFGTADDATDPDAGNYYRTNKNLPWALAIPYEINQMIERTDIILGYPNFGIWAQSGGISKKDWYITEMPENINKDKVFIKK